jgi:L,D-peptidoglycan transpeptidase YkuD (ErfK/YbiS/YcfS/YnhG family)
MFDNLIRNFVYIFLTFMVFGFYGWGQVSRQSPIPSNSDQLIVVITGSFDTQDAHLFRFQREDSFHPWINVTEAIPAIVGRNGLGWGIGLQHPDSTLTPLKKEGDGKSPAGVFTLSAVFGYAPVENMDGLKMPYIHIVEMLECVDDVNSLYYNSMVMRTAVDSVDWESSERMWRGKIWYEQGVVVDHNMNPAQPGCGSCIFLHNWAGPDDTTSGCTAMDPAELRKIIFWLDSSKNPLLVQLPKTVYARLQQPWNLPSLDFSR